MQVSQLFDLSGRTALVTGGGRGIGRHLAIGLAEAGADVCVVSRSLDACEATAHEVEKAGVRGRAFQADLSNPEAIDGLVEEVTRQTGYVDVLVNNAAMVWAASTLDYPLSAWDRVFDLNVKGLFYLSQHFGKGMVARGAGSIIQIASISAWRGASDDEQPVIAYNASKGAVVSLTIDMAVKLAPHGVRVNAIAPGPFLTDMTGRGCRLTAGKACGGLAALDSPRLEPMSAWSPATSMSARLSRARWRRRGCAGGRSRQISRAPKPSTPSSRTSPARRDTWTSS